MTLNKVLSIILGSDGFSNLDFSISDGEAHTKKVTTFFFGHPAFVLEVYFDKEQEFIDICVHPHRYAPDEDLSDETLRAAFEIGDKASGIIKESFSEVKTGWEWLKSFTLNVSCEGRWSHAELCDFWPDRPELNDVDMY